MFDWQGLGILTGIGAVFATLGYFMSLRWWIATGNSVDRASPNRF
jgi:hypothetical protein